MNTDVFLDTNLILDVVLERPGFESTMEILQKGTEGKIKLYTSFLSMANIAYVLRKNYNGVMIPTLKQISMLLEVLPMDSKQLKQAMLLAGPDYEDILQAVCATAGGCTVLLTRNPKHFNIKSGLLPKWVAPEVYTPEEFLSLIK